MYDEQKLGDHYRHLIGERIKQRRTLAGYRTQKDYAEQSPFTVGRVKSWENGARLPPPWVLAHMAEEFKTSAAYLSGFTDNPDQEVTKNDYFHFISQVDHIDQDGERYAFQWDNTVKIFWVNFLANGSFLLLEDKDDPKKGAEFFRPGESSLRLIGKVLDSSSPA